MRRTGRASGSQRASAQSSTWRRRAWALAALLAAALLGMALSAPGQRLRALLAWRFAAPEERWDFVCEASPEDGLGRLILTAAFADADRTVALEAARRFEAGGGRLSEVELEAALSVPCLELRSWAAGQLAEGGRLRDPSLATRALLGDFGAPAQSAAAGLFGKVRDADVAVFDRAWQSGDATQRSALEEALARVAAGFPERAQERAEVWLRTRSREPQALDEAGGSPR